ncbi:MAG: ATP-binding protein [Xanthomonadales bacterium]|nr:ATP-binding protein [Xanthomonadales bacterium]
MLVDELDTSLQPALMRHLLGLFHDPATNPHGAQLIFTTHDTSVLDRSLLRRDQVWFVEKDREQQTRLYPAHRLPPAQGGELRPRLPAGTLRGGALPQWVVTVRLARTFPIRHGRRYPRNTLQKSGEGSKP